MIPMRGIASSVDWWNWAPKGAGVPRLRSSRLEREGHARISPSAAPATSFNTTPRLAMRP